MKKFNTIGQEEYYAATLAVRGSLSGYIGSNPNGGRNCVALEEEWIKVFGCRYAVAVNSATSGLLAACMACGVGHDDEVIVSPYTMSATAAAPKVLGAKIVFADIEPETYTIDPVEVANKITKKTVAVIATNLFGHPARLHELKQICDDTDTYLIEDNAQAIYAKEEGRYTGTIGDIGVFSLNVHKQLQVGEGGICTTDYPALAKNLREAMNHGEMRGDIVGLNLRMTEITAAMAREQLRKGLPIVHGRQTLWYALGDDCMERKLPISIPIIRQDCSHSAYVWAAQLLREPSVSRLPLPEPFRHGYMAPLYTLPAFLGSPLDFPVAETVERKMVLVELCSIDPTEEEIAKMLDDLGRAL